MTKSSGRRIGSKFLLYLKVSAGFGMLGDLLKVLPDVRNPKRADARPRFAFFAQGRPHGPRRCALSWMRRYFQKGKAARPNAFWEIVPEKSRIAAIHLVPQNRALPYFLIHVVIRWPFAQPVNYRPVTTLFHEAGTSTE